MDRALFFSRFYYILFGIAVVSLPFTLLAYTVITPLLLILWIIEGDWKNKWNRLKESHTLVIICSLALLWLLNIIGLFYAEDLMKGVEKTYNKLSFLIYPVVLFTLDKTFFTEKRVHTLFKGFLCATATMLMLNWGNAFVQYFTTNEAHHFYYIYFSRFSGHPSYGSLMVCIAFTVAFYFLNFSIRQLKLTAMVLAILLFFFAISIYFFQSRGGILAFGFVLLFSFFYYLHARKKTYWYAIGGIVAILLLAVIITKLFPSRMGYFMDKMSTEQWQAKDILGLRSDIWDISYQLAMQHKVWGIGIGYDVESYLTSDNFEVFGKPDLIHAPSFINAHNQFLQTFLEYGIVGLCVFLFFIIYSFYFAIKTKNYLLLMLLISVVVNLCFESMFERGFGVFTFSLFYGLFIVKKNIFANLEKKTQNL